MAKHSTYMQRKLAQQMWLEGKSLAAVARELGFNEQTVSGWKKKEGWVRQRMEAYDADMPPLPEPVAVEPDPAPAAAPVDSEAALRRRIEELEAANRQLEADNERLSPTRDIQAMLDDRVAWLTDNSPEGERYWLNRAEAEYKNENISRAKQGLPVFSVKDNPEILDNLINELKTKEAMARATEPDEPPSRKVKMFIMRNGMPTIEQIPMEPQVNNMAGSLADGIVRYAQKGFKLTSPMLCPRAGCFNPAAVDTMGRWQFDGYCTQRHHDEVEGGTPSPLAGMNVRGAVTAVG